MNVHIDKLVYILFFSSLTSFTFELICQRRHKGLTYYRMQQKLLLCGLYSSFSYLKSFMEFSIFSAITNRLDYAVCINDKLSFMSSVERPDIFYEFFIRKGSPLILINNFPHCFHNISVYGKVRHVLYSKTSILNGLGFILPVVR